MKTLAELSRSGSIAETFPEHVAFHPNPHRSIHHPEAFTRKHPENPFLHVDSWYLRVRFSRRRG
jgi:hypothetical protein